MSHLYDDAIVQKALEHAWGSRPVPESFEIGRHDMVDALEVVAPLIAAKALRDAAKECRGSDMLPAIPRSRVRAWLGDLAAEIERGRS